MEEQARDKVCRGLRALGIDAQLALRGRYEEGTAPGSLGLIDIPEGPIRWVNIRQVSYPQRGTDYYTDYGVPDSKLGYNSPKLRIKTVRVKTFPLFGKVVDLRWEGKDFHREIISRLGMDFSIKLPIMKSCQLTIENHGVRKCWTISTKTRHAPSKELWNCYQTIAQHLLAVWLPSHKNEKRIPLQEYTEDGWPLEESTNVCPECGSSNINKAIKRMPKSQQEIEVLGFRAEWDCLCFNCRHSWVEREK